LQNGALKLASVKNNISFPKMDQFLLLNRDWEVYHMFTKEFVRIVVVGRMNYRRAEERRQSRSVEKTKDVERDDLWRFVMNNDLISLSIDNRLY
jgi:hypothetical protein